MRKIIIGVMGRGENATANDLQNAYILGQLIAKQGWADTIAGGVLLWAKKLGMLLDVEPLREYINGLMQRPAFIRPR